MSKNTQYNQPRLRTVVINGLTLMFQAFRRIKRLKALFDHQFPTTKRNWETPTLVTLKDTTLQDIIVK